MHVLKFGGTSVGDADSIRRVGAIVRERSTRPLVLVFSAVGDTTDRLAGIGDAATRGRLGDALKTLKALEGDHRTLLGALFGKGEPECARACARLFREIDAMARGISVLLDCSPAVRDRLLGYGEQLSTLILAAHLKREGLPAVWVDARDCVVTDGRHGGAEPMAGPTAVQTLAVLSPLLAEGKLPVTQGFVARSASGAPTTLGRGGSDYTAALLGAALGAEEIGIWTDVDGVMTADPSLVPDARSIASMTFREAAELAFCGARVLHPKTLAPAVEHGIPVRVLNTRRPEGAGTLILARAPDGAGPVRSIAYKEGQAVVSLVSARMFKFHGFLKRVFEILDRHGVTPGLVATSSVSVALAVEGGPGLEAAAAELRELGQVSVRERQAVVSVVGETLKATPGIVGQVFEDLRDIYIAMVSQGGSEIHLSFAVAEADLPTVVRRLHRRLFEGDKEPMAVPPAGPRAFPEGAWQYVG